MTIPDGAKLCSQCHKVKTLDEFHNRAASKDGKRTQCKDCDREYNRDYGKKNKEAIRVYNANRYVEKREYILDYSKGWHARNKEYTAQYMREYRDVNRDAILASGKKWYWNNWDKKRSSRKLWNQNNKPRIAASTRLRRQSNISFRLGGNLRTRIRYALKRHQANKSASTYKLVGCSIFELREHLQSSFTSGMTWDNYGIVWEIDHIKPCVLFNLVREEEQRSCFHWSNLRPLLVSLNRSKGPRYTVEVNIGTPS